MNDLKILYSVGRPTVENYKFISCLGRKNSKYVFVGWDVIFGLKDGKKKSYSVYYKVLRLKYNEMNRLLRSSDKMLSPITFSKFYNVLYNSFGIGSIVSAGKRYWYEILL